MNKLKITLVKSKFGRKPNQRATLSALGLKKINQAVVHTPNDCIKGMVNIVRHLVKVEVIV